MSLIFYLKVQFVSFRGALPFDANTGSVFFHGHSRFPYTLERGGRGDGLAISNYTA